MASRDNRGPTPKALAIVAGVAAFGLAVSILVGRSGSSSAEKSAVDVADNVLPSLLDPSDLAAPVIGSRYDQLASAIEKAITPNILRVTVWQKSGVVVFSTNPDLVGLAVSGAKPMVDSAFSGKVQSSVGIGDAMPTDGSQQGETYRTFAPIRLQPGDPVTGVAEIVQPVPAGSGSQLWSAAKLVFNVVLIVSLVWLWVVMGRKSNRAARVRRYDEKQREKAAAAARVARQQEPAPAPTPQPVVEGPLFSEERAPAVQKPKEAERPRLQGIPAADTWAFGPESPEPARRKAPKKPAAKPKVTEPEIVQPAASEAPAVEPEVAQPVAVEPEVAQPVAIEPEVAQPVAAGLRHDQLGEAELEKGEEEFDPGAWIVPRFEQEARRREAELAGALPVAEPTPSVPEEVSVEAKEQDGLQAAQEAQAAPDTRDEEREAAEAKEREAAEAKEREEREAAEAALVARAAEREAAQAVHAAELEGLPEAAEAKEREEREAAEKQALEARDAALLEAAMAREESIRAAETARAAREKARAAQEAARAAREEISELEAEIVKLEEARRVEAEARDKVRAAEDAARAAREEELQLEEEARRLREEIRRA